MFVAGISLYAALVFSFLSFLVAVPSAVKVFNWTATHVQRLDLALRRPMLYAFGFIGLFTMGGLTGLFLACLGVDVHVTTPTSSSPTSTTSWSAARSWVIWAACISGGRKFPVGCIPKAGARFAALIVFIGFNLTFFPQFVLGYLGMPRRYWHYRRRNFRSERALDGRRVHSGGRIPAADGLFPLVAALRQDRGPTIRGSQPAWSGRPPPRRRPSTSTRRPVVTWEAYDTTRCRLRRR